MRALVSLSLLFSAFILPSSYAQEISPQQATELVAKSDKAMRGDSSYSEATMEMMPVDKPGQKTVLTTHQAQFDFKIDDDFFSLSQMKSLRE